MAASISGLLLVSVTLYLLAFSRFHFFWDTAPVARLRELIDGNLLLAHAAVLGVALLSLGVSSVGLFYTRQQRELLSNKKVLLGIVLLAGVASALLIYKIGRLVIPLLGHGSAG